MFGFVLVMIGCGDTSVDPFQNDDQLFSVYGFLDESRFDQVLRVVPVTRRGATISERVGEGATIDAVVTTKDLSTGETIRWTHQLERLANGEYAHIYRASFNVIKGRHYRLEIVREDGKMT